MRKIKQWYKKLNKFEKVIFWIIFAILTFFLLVALINITISLGYAGIKLKLWFNKIKFNSTYSPSWYNWER